MRWLVTLWRAFTRPMMSMDQFLEAARPENFDEWGREAIERDLGLRR